MLKNKKSLAVILSLVMLLAMACGAWAATYVPKVDAAAGENKSYDGDMTVTDDSADDYEVGLRARGGGTITYTGGTITTAGQNGFGAYVSGSGSSIDITGHIVTNGTPDARAVYMAGGYLKMVGNMTVNQSETAIMLQSKALADFKGTITVNSNNAWAVLVQGTPSFAADPSDKTQGSTMNIEGNIVTTGTGSVAVEAIGGGTLNMSGGTITLNDDDDSLALRVRETVAGSGTINLTDMTIDVKNLFTLDGGTGTLVVKSSDLTGDIVAAENSAATVKLTEDTSLTGAINATGVGTSMIELILDESVWNVTGDSTTNGDVTADSGSAIDYSDAPANTTVTIDVLMGEPAITMKSGDKLIMLNHNLAGTGTVVDLVSSNSDVLEVQKTGDVYSITAKDDGKAELTYTYNDGNEEQTVTLGVTVGDGAADEVTPDVTGGDPETIVTGDEVEITYDFGDDNDVTIKDDSGLDGSGLTVGTDDDGNIVLTGDAGEPGNYSFDVEVTDENGNSVIQTMPVNIAATYTTTPEGDIETGTDVEVTYDFGDDYTPIPVIDNSGMQTDISGLLADIVDGKVVLKGIAKEPGSYYYIVTLQRADGTTFKQKVMVEVLGASDPTATNYGGGSSNCNAGMGFGALFGLLGLALIQKRK